jgi:hypothetical protein
MSINAIAQNIVNPYSYYGQPIVGRMEVPVRASESLYAQFQYVRGVASAEGGVSLDRLKIIDSLLAQINAHRQAGAAPVKREDVDLSKPEQAIAELSNQVHEMQKAATPFQAWGTTQSQGLVFNLSA